MIAPYRITDDELLGVEIGCREALARRSIDGLTVVGFGEVGVALGWPDDDPRLVLKRGYPAMSEEEAVARKLDLDRNVEMLRDAGVIVVPTEFRVLDRGDGVWFVYNIQPLVGRDELAETVLATDEPAVGHPMLVAMRELAVEIQTDRLGFDSQFSNFAWDGEYLTMLDVGSKLWWDEDGHYAGGFDGFLHGIPALVRPTLRRTVDSITRTYMWPRGALGQNVAFLWRLGADRWVEPAIATYNEVLDEPLVVEELRATYERQLKEFPRLNRMVRWQRTWRTRIRRKPFDFFVTDSFAGTIEP